MLKLVDFSVGFCSAECFSNPPDNLKEANSGTFWRTDDPVSSVELVLNFENPATNITEIELKNAGSPSIECIFHQERNGKGDGISCVPKHRLIQGSLSKFSSQSFSALKKYRIESVMSPWKEIEVNSMKIILENSEHEDYPINLGLSYIKILSSSLFPGPLAQKSSMEEIPEQNVEGRQRAGSEIRGAPFTSISGVSSIEGASPFEEKEMESPRAKLKGFFSKRSETKEMEQKPIFALRKIEKKQMAKINPFVEELLFENHLLVSREKSTKEQGSREMNLGKRGKEDWEKSNERQESFKGFKISKRSQFVEETLRKNEKEEKNEKILAIEESKLATFAF